MLHSVLCAVNLGIIVLDGERRIVLWNSWMVKHSGLTNDKVIGADFFAICPSLRGGRIDAAIQQALYDNFPSLLSQSLATRRRSPVRQCRRRPATNASSRRSK
jgi:PAS domain-containing protein